jgi:DNA repair exonuclease SbcCD nuclease subunit
MARYYLSEGAQEQYSQARFDAIRTMGRIAKEEECQFMLVCGDAFESNQVERKTVARTLEALKDVPVPVYILPGNHDPLNDASVYHSSTFIDRKPSHVHIIEDSVPIKVVNGLEIVGAPWLSKRSVTNPINGALSPLAPVDDVTRICLGHGAIDILSPNPESAGLITISVLERAISEKKVHFVALGDCHSLTKVGNTERIWFSGTPEPTDFSEPRAGYALVVDITDERVSTKQVEVGQWRFIERAHIDLNTGDDVESFCKSLDEIKNKERAIVKLNLVGSLSLSLRGILEEHINAVKDVFGALIVKEDDLHVLPDDTDFADLGFSGFADATVQRLRSALSGGGSDAITARDALLLLMRLAKEAK